ncbi:hypothetical protein OEIGOIKO_00084 [Streptomyces chrestomyceticus JCM 4735]|uniref:Uncharacterized protein n=1 Tax=Streptomyces chrestomyceticus JCM 4735 TaxID=1306181 RepID=A0A7U9KPC2_9ACTN|nr:hypothetical protein OEIGOIKO_00084 [Streptomyces chrestomyceticus JCM 4735]
MIAHEYRVKGARAIGAHPGERGPFGPYGGDNEHQEDEDAPRRTLLSGRTLAPPWALRSHRVATPLRPAEPSSIDRQHFSGYS